MDDNTVRCAYCGGNIPEECNIVPDFDDDETWNEIAKHHEKWCDWIKTRAHSRKVSSNWGEGSHLIDLNYPSQRRND